LETTLSGLTYAKRIAAWRDAGFRVKPVFLSLPDVETAIKRVAARVLQGGHSIPELVIRRRFASGLHNFHRRYKPLVDAWRLYNNAGEKPELLELSE
jgi:predicted ABC-type ATPase